MCEIPKGCGSGGGGSLPSAATSVRARVRLFIFYFNIFQCVVLQVQQPKVTSVLTEPQRALISTISEGQKAVEQAQEILETKLEVPDLGTDPVRVLCLIIHLIDAFHNCFIIVGLNQMETDAIGHEQTKYFVANCSDERGYGLCHHSHFWYSFI